MTTGVLSRIHTLYYYNVMYTLHSAAYSLSDPVVEMSQAFPLHFSRLLYIDVTVEARLILLWVCTGIRAAAF
jgi:hypothetical protein